MCDLKKMTIVENNSHVNINTCLKVAANVSSEQAFHKNDLVFSCTFNEFHMMVAIMPIENENLGSFLSNIFQEYIFEP